MSNKKKSDETVADALNRTPLSEKPWGVADHETLLALTPGLAKQAREVRAASELKKRRETMVQHVNGVLTLSPNTTHLNRPAWEVNLGRIFERGVDTGEVREVFDHFIERGWLGALPTSLKLLLWEPS